jgi:hypothetical protein
MQLQASCLMESRETERRLKRKIQEATESHSKVVTPYGPVVQQVALANGMMWDVCHPFAFLWYLSSISTCFAQVMKDCMKSGAILRLVIYVDGLVPGNPFRPEASRKLQCVYWSFVDWPNWMLTRTFAWPCLSILRQKIVEENLDGRMSYFARIVLRLFP